MTTFQQLLLVPFLLTGLPNNHEYIQVTPGTYHTGNNSIIDKQQQRTMGISINLYRLGKAEKLSDIKDIESQIAKTTDTKVDLYKMTEEMAFIFMNSTDPYDDTDTIPYKMLFGKRAEQSVSVGEIGGFLPSSEVAEVSKWIKANKIQTFDGFSAMYDNLSAEVKKALEEIGGDDMYSLYYGYVRPLVVLYFTALENENSVVFIGL